MRQHAINLLSESIRARSQARVRTARSIAAAVIASVLLIVLATHARLLASRTRVRLERAEERAAHALSLEQRADTLEAMLAEGEAFIQRYDQVAMPLPLSAVLATVCNQLPESVTLDTVHLDAARRRGASARARPAATDGPPPRVLTGEISGFAATDVDIAELVDRMVGLPPLSGVALDFSRTRTVRGRPAREFRLSFRIDLEVPYQTHERRPAPTRRAAAPAIDARGGR